MRHAGAAATLATDGLIGTDAGPRDPGTAYVLAHHYAGRALGVQGAWGFVRGGMGAVSGRSPRRRARGRRDVAHRRDVDRDRAARRARGALDVAPTAATIDAGAILSNADPGTLVRAPAATATTSRPAFCTRAAAWRSERRLAEDQSRARRTARFHAPPRHARCRRTTARRFTSRRRSTIFNGPPTTRARGDVSSAPMLECFMQTPTDPIARTAGQTHPLDLRAVLSVRPQRRPVDAREGGGGRPTASSRSSRGTRRTSRRRSRTGKCSRAARSRGAIRARRRPHLSRRVVAGADLRGALRRAHAASRACISADRGPIPAAASADSPAGAPQPRALAIADLTAAR